AAFSSARRFLLAADVLGISASLRQRPSHGIRDQSAIHTPTHSAAAMVFERRKLAPSVVMSECPALMAISLDNDNRLCRVRGCACDWLRTLGEAILKIISRPGITVFELRFVRVF